MVRCVMRAAGPVTAAVLALTGALTFSAPASGAPAVSEAKIVLTNASNGSTVLAEKGDKVVVKLSGHGSVRWTQAWVEPPGTAANGVLVKDSGRTFSDGSSVTRFTVVGYGGATLVADGMPICSSVCPTYILRWTATVGVPVRDPPTPSS